MNDDRFKLIFSGLIEGTEIDVAKAAIQERFQLRHDSMDKWFGVEHATIKRDLTQDQAWKLQTVLESFGVEASMVLQTRSNLHLDRMEVIPPTPAKPRPAIQIRNYQPNGMAQFSAQPLSGRMSQGAANRNVPARRRTTNRTTQHTSGESSFKLTHFVAAAVLIVLVSVAGKQLLMPSDSISQPVAAWSE